MQSGYILEKILVLWAETPLYVGSGRGEGTIDLELQKEILTNYPEVRSTSLKGALRNNLKLTHENANDKDEWERIIEIFWGGEDSTLARIGKLIFLDAKILLFPVKSSIDNFIFVTSPLQLERFLRLLKRLKENTQIDLNIEIERPSDNEIIFDNKANIDNAEAIYLLDGLVKLTAKKTDLSKLIEILISIIDPKDNSYNYLLDKIRNSLAIVSDSTFEVIVDKGLIRVARIRINPETKTTEERALFFQELVPEYTVFFSGLLIFELRLEAKEKQLLEKLYQELDGLQFNLGGDESTGRGFVRLKLHP